jgi:hypothetical protein
MLDFPAFAEPLKIILITKSCGDFFILLILRFKEYYYFNKKKI